VASFRDLIKGKKPSVQARATCSRGHGVDPSWDVCPYCEAENTSPGKTGVVRAPAPKRRLAGWIVGLNGDYLDEDLRLRAGSNLIGTDTGCDVVITGAAIASRHCVIQIEGGEFHLSVLDGRGKTFVNEAPVKTQALIDNDVIKLGDLEFELKCRAARERR
jgi:hypothetical protein